MLTSIDNTLQNDTPKNNIYPFGEDINNIGGTNNPFKPYFLEIDKFIAYFNHKAKLMHFRSKFKEFGFVPGRRFNVEFNNDKTNFELTFCEDGKYTLKKLEQGKSVACYIHFSEFWVNNNALCAHGLKNKSIKPKFIEVLDQNKTKFRLYFDLDQTSEDAVSYDPKNDFNIKPAKSSKSKMKDKANFNIEIKKTENGICFSLENDKSKPVSVSVEHDVLNMFFAYLKSLKEVIYA